jgi:hypothetical protein
VRRYDQIIGTATQDIAPGQHVHTHNLAFSELRARARARCGRVPTAFVAAPATFHGHRAADGRVATRNYIGVLTSVNCSATAARAIADHFRRDIRPEALADFPNVDGVVALTHGMGCATASDGEELQVLRRTLGGYARHANFCAVLVVGLGCETNQIQGLVAQEGWPKAHAWSPSASRTAAARRRPWPRASRSSAGCCPRRPTACSASRCRPATSPWACSAAAPTATAASAPTRRWGRRWTAWCAMAAPRSCRKRPRSTAANTC